MVRRGHFERALRGAAGVAVLAWVVLLPACGADEVDCRDADRDGFGPGCANGPDCDDANPARTDDCDTVPPADCGATPFAAGCPCLPGTTADCYGGPDGTEGLGICRAGRTACLGSVWGLCEGSVESDPETCDGVDEDCDGLVDEGVRSPCGGCTPGCLGAVWGGPTRPFEAGDGLAVGPRGALTLARQETLDATTVWVANSADGTVSRIDALEAVETARYDSGGSEPSRVAVDYRGDAWVANRVFEGVSTVTKIAGVRERCEDREGDGIETSSGPDDVLPAGEDDCVLWTVPVGEPAAVARALAIDGDRGLDGASGGNAWVGLHDAQRVVELDGITGAVRRVVETPGFSPYAAAFDPWGTLWMASRDGLIARLDRDADAADIGEVPFPCFLLYSLSLDRAGRLALTGFSCDQVLLHDPATGRWDRLATPPSTRGVAVLEGTAWVAHTGGQLSEVSMDPFRLERTLALADSGITPIESIGVGVDGTGAVWVASSQGAPGGLGVATRVEDGVVTAQVPVGRAPHTQGDLSGAELVGGFVAEGRTQAVFEGCPDDGTRWLRVHLAAQAGAAGRVEIAFRHAARRGELDEEAFQALGIFPDDPGPFPLDAPEGGVLELRLTLVTDARDGAPRVERIGVEWGCPGPG